MIDTDDTSDTHHTNDHPTPPNAISLTVIIPIYNEAGYVGKALEQIKQEISTILNEYHIILVENGSTDNTFDEISAYEHISSAQPTMEIIRLPDPDYGLAVRTGMRKAGGQGWLVLFDIDYYSGMFISDIMKATDEYDVILASKRVAGSQDQRPWLRRVTTWGFNAILRAFTKSTLTDTHGVKAIRASIAQRLLPEVKMNKDLFDTELLLRAERAGYRINEVPVLVSELRKSRSGMLRRIVRNLWGIVKLSYYIRNT